MILNDVKPGDVFLIRSRGFWYSDAIAWFMKSQWSHCGFVRYKAVTGENITLETSDYEMTYGSLEKYVAHPEKYHLKVFRVNGAFESEEKQQLAMSITDELYWGNLYGYLQLLSFAVVCLGRRVGIKIPNFIRQGQVCTAGPLHYLSQSTHPLFAGVDPESLQTQDFADMLDKVGAEVIFESGK